MSKRGFWTVKVNNKFFVHSGKTSDEYPEARVFYSYDEALDAIELFRLTANDALVELFSDYGTENETVEDI